MQMALTAAVAFNYAVPSGTILKVLKVKQDFFLKCVLPKDQLLLRR